MSQWAALSLSLILVLYILLEKAMNNRKNMSMKHKFSINAERNLAS